MFLPNYFDGSIVNLMSSIKKAFDGKHSYKELKILPSRELKQSKNIVLIVLDGLGYNYLLKNLKGTIFEKGLKGNMTSVFPPTTATAIPTFLTGLAPQQHAITGWHGYLKELGVVAKTFGFNARVGGKPFTSIGIKVKDIFECKGFSEGLKASSYLIQHKLVAKSDFSKAMAGKSKLLGFSSLKGFSNQIIKTVKSHNKRKFIYAYWHEFDSIAHKKGVNNKQAEQHFKELSVEIEKLVKRLKNSNTTIIVTADHGFIDSSKEELIKLKDHSELSDCLTLPLCGDSRVIYCFVRAGKAKQFEEYVRTRMKKYCFLFKSRDLIVKGFFGLFKPNPKLFDRVGDYTLIMKDNYVLKDSITGTKKKFKKGRHSGVSKEEMVVPLVVFKS
ncbi:MAG: alkaline phosphatase family protein [archaeon]